VSISPGDGEREPGDASSARTPAVGVLYRSEGQRLLAALPFTGGEIARKLGTNRASVSAWRLGDKVPSPDAQRALAAAFPSIPLRSWSMRPEGYERPPAGPERPASGADVEPALESLAMVDRLIADVGEKLNLPDLTTSELDKLTTVLNRLFDRRDKIVEDAEGFETRFVRSLSGRRFMRALLDALKPHPGAMRDVEAAFAEIED
jgi:transcriptional regulator with XRE-family HTH domain